MVNLSKSISVFSDGNVLVSSLALRVGTFGIVNPDYNQVWKLKDHEGVEVTLKKLDRNSRNEILMGNKQGANYFTPSGQAVPATARFLRDEFVLFKPELQLWFHYEINGGKTSEAQAKKDFAQCFRDNAWITNNAGSWTREDVINNNGKPPYIQIQPMATGGALLKIVGTTTYRGYPAYLVEAINPSVEFKKYHPSTHRHLFYRPTSSARVRYINTVSGKVMYKCWYEEPINSWYGEKMEMPVFGFMPDERSSTGWVNLIEANRVQPIANTDPIPNPYIMRDGRILENPYYGF